MARGGSRGVGQGACIYPPAIFKNVFDVHNLSIISNLFDSNMPYALSTHNRKCATKCMIFGEASRIRVKKLEQNLPENYSNSTKIAILTAFKFSKNFPGEHAPGLPRVFLVSQSALNLFSQKNALEKNVEIMPPPPPPF